MKSTLFLATLLATPWAMQPEVISAYAGVLARSYGAKSALVERDAADVAAGHKGGGAQAAAKPAYSRSASGSIAVLPLHGTIMQRAGMIEMCGGGTSVETFTRNLREAMADETVSQILIDIDSPGGSVYGVAELAAEIQGYRQKKNIVAISNSLAASAAYWVGAAASEMYCTPSGEVGSIGVWQAHEDWSKALDEMGIKTTLISAGKYKTEGNPYQALDGDAQAFMQSRVDDYYQAFIKGVAKARNVGVDAVRNGMGQGRVLGPQAALAEKMIDGVATLDDVLKRMQRSAAPAKNRSALAAARNEIELLG